MVGHAKGNSLQQKDSLLAWVRHHLFGALGIVDSVLTIVWALFVSLRLSQLSKKLSCLRYTVGVADVSS